MSFMIRMLFVFFRFEGSQYNQLARPPIALICRARALIAGAQGTPFTEKGLCWTWPKACPGV